MPLTQKEEIKNKIRNALSWNGFDEEVIEPIYSIFESFLAADHAHIAEPVEEKIKFYRKATEKYLEQGKEKQAYGAGMAEQSYRYVLALLQTP